MNDIGKMTLLTDESVDGAVEGHRKSGHRTTGHSAGDLNRTLEFEQRKSQGNGLVFGNDPRCVDKHAIGSDIFNDIPERSLVDRILDNDKRGLAGVVALVVVTSKIHLIILALENRKMSVL